MTDLTLNFKTEPTTPELVVKKKARRISPTQLSVWHSCEQKWHYNYVEDLVPRSQPAYFARGTLVHEVLSIYYQLLQGGLKPGSQEAIKMTMEWVAEDLTFKNLQGGNATMYAEVLRVVNRYMRDWSPVVDRDLKILEVEKLLQVLLTTPKGREVILEGILDLLVMRRDYTVWILDHKSTGIGQFWSQMALQMDSQLPTYIAVTELLGTPVHGMILNEINTYPYKNFDNEPIDKIFRRTPSSRNVNELRYILMNYLRAVDDQEDKLESGLPIVRNLTRNCDRCMYNELCQFAVKGIPTETLKAQKFKKKDAQDKKMEGD